MSGYQALSLPFTVAADDSDLDAYLSEVFAALRTEAPTGEPLSYRVADGWLRAGRERVASGSPAYLLAMLVWHLNQQVVRRSSPDLVLLHAAMATRGQVGVLLPAPMGAGKTTTVLGLLRRGWAYVTDEAVAVDPATLAVRPFPKALSLERGTWPLVPELAPARSDWVHSAWQLPPHAVPALVAPPGVRITHIIAPAYCPGARTRLEPISRARMLMLLAASSFEFTARAQRNLAVGARLVDTAEGCWQLPIGDLNEAVSLIEQVGA